MTGDESKRDMPVTERDTNNTHEEDPLKKTLKEERGNDPFSKKRNHESKRDRQLEEALWTHKIDSAILRLIIKMAGISLDISQWHEVCEAMLSELQAGREIIDPTAFAINYLKRKGVRT